MDFLLTLQELRTPVLDAIILSVTRLGEELFALIPLLLCYWCIDKRLGLRIGFTFFAGGIANQFSKVIFNMFYLVQTTSSCGLSSTYDP